MKILYILVLVFLISGCSKDISGEVFVVTNSGQSVKLGLVEVIAISEQNLAACVNEKTQDWITKHQRLFEEYSSEQKTLEQQQKAHYFTKGTIELMQDNIAAEVYPSESKVKELEELIKSYSIYLSEHEKAMNKLNILKKEYGLLKKGAFVIDCIKADIVTKVITNADGQFSMKVPNEKIALFATSRRNISGEPEEYYWLIWVDRDVKHVMLSNNNIYETLCPTCIVKLKGLPE